MNRSAKNIVLLVVVVLIVLAIWYLESQKVSSPSDAAPQNDAIDLNATSTSATSTPLHTSDFAQLEQEYPAAKELVSPDGYINTGGQPITIASLIGKKVILLDFWTYSCINCQRVIPYLNAWYAKYKDAGLEIIGIHTPEFNFEKNIDNVQAAVQKFGIEYPVVLDSEDQTWNAYGNQYWPEEYLIDINGLIVDRNIGEGNYAATEEKIQQLLQQRAELLGEPASTVPTGLVDLNYAIDADSPETYFGAERNQFLSNGTQSQTGPQTLVAPSMNAVQPNELYLGGQWDFEDQYAQNTAADAVIEYHYDAQHVYFVAAAPKGVTITVMRDGKPLTSDQGSDVDAQGRATIQEARLYDLIDQPSMQEHTLEIIIHNPGLQAYTFTFG